MKIKALLVAAVLAGEFGLCFASTDGDLIQGVIPYPDSVSVTSVVKNRNKSKPNPSATVHTAKDVA